MIDSFDTHFWGDIHSMGVGSSDRLSQVQSLLSSLPEIILVRSLQEMKPKRLSILSTGSVDWHAFLAQTAYGTKQVLVRSHLDGKP